MRVPDIALGSEISLTEIAAEELGGYPFEKFEEHRRAHREIERQKITPETAGVGHAHKQFANRVGEQEAVEKMHETIEVVALETEDLVERAAEKRTCPVVVGDFGVRPMRAELVQTQEEKDERVADERQGKMLPRDAEENDESEDEDVFQHPVMRIMRTDGRARDHAGEQHDERGEVTSTKARRRRRSGSGKRGLHTDQQSRNPRRCRWGGCVTR